ncbi:endonuclease/exonuclease/phosphatase family protein [Streptomyces sp. NPDC006510]|uniref:endonuclease/exonuclease/phosphatase family protein n=1 Tax=Streptomyces sp. NPDC006510 TaxID=3155600 RepID=UPI0033BB2AAB
MKLRVVSFNCLFGGYSGHGFGAPERWDALMRFLRSLDADIVALQECNGWDVLGKQRLHRAVRDCRLAGGVLAEANVTTAGHRFHTAILHSSRVNIAADGANRQKYHHVLGWVDLYVPGLEKVLEIRNVHLDPFDAAGRIHEVEPLKIHGATGRLSVVLGDFNTVPPAAPQPPWDTLPPHAQLHHREVADPTHMAGTAAEVLVSAGMVDLAALKGQARTPTGGFDSCDVARRQDLILLSQDLAPLATAYHVYMEPITDEFSDHAAVGAVLDLAPLLS